MQMKRILAGLALAALTLVLAATVADAAGYRYANGGKLSWRTHLAAVAGTEPTAGDARYGVDAAGGYVDSTQFYVPNAADGKDTSAVWFPPNDFCIAAAADSMPVLLIVKNSAAGASGDTLHLGPQAFIGGDQSVAANFVATAAFPAVTNRVLTGAITSGTVRLFRAGAGGAFAGSETAASTAPSTTMVVPSLDRWAFRLITWGDGTAAFSGGGYVTVEVLYPVCQ